MNCDLILTENSCRYCLGDAQDGNVISQRTYFYVEKRLIECGEILKYLELTVAKQQKNVNKNILKFVFSD